MGPLTFFGADCVEIASGEASREGPMEPLVPALLILHRLLVERDGLPQWLVCNTEKQSRCRRHRSAGRTGVRLRSLGLEGRTPVTHAGLLQMLLQVSVESRGATALSTTYYCYR